MDFTFVSLSDAFKHSQTCPLSPLYAFVLAGTSRRNILPDLICNFHELHELTYKYIRVIAPSLLIPRGEGQFSGSWSSNERANPYSEYNEFYSTDTKEVMTTLRTGKLYYQSNGIHYQDVSNEVDEFIVNYTMQSIKFARFCDIDESKLPCIVFFNRLDNPQSYIVWWLKDKDIQSTLYDIARIIMHLKSELSSAVELIEHEQEIKNHRHSLHKNIDTLEFRFERDELQKRKTKIELLETQITKKSKRLAGLQWLITNRDRKEVIPKYDKLKNKIEKLQQELNHTTTEYDHYIRERENIIRQKRMVSVAKIRQMDKELLQIEQKLSEVNTDLLQKLHTRSAVNTTLHFFRDLKEYLPIEFNLF